MSDKDQAWMFKEIPIDFEVYKALTAHLESPADSYNTVLRRILNLPEVQPVSVTANAQPWTVDGVTFPHNTEFRHKFRGGRVITGRVDDGALVVNGVRYSSPSPAAIAVTRTGKTSSNGWGFWECRRPGQNDWTVIDGLRKK